MTRTAIQSPIPEAGEGRLSAAAGCQGDAAVSGGVPKGVSLATIAQPPGGPWPADSDPALPNAGGFSAFCRPEAHHPPASKASLKFNLKEVRAGQHLERNTLLQPGDEIFVK
jgi:hypothetical protein